MVSQSDGTNQTGDKQMNNLELWQKVEKTDPRHTKKARIGQMNITAICPQYQRMTATAMFGPFGHGWGVEDPVYSFMDFPDSTKLCTYTATFWFIHQDKKSSFPIQSNTKVAFITQGGKGYLKIDDEYAKKAANDALTKGLSMLGFNSDVFLGKYDDNKYVNQVTAEFQQQAPLPKPQMLQQAPVITTDQVKVLMTVGAGANVPDVKAIISKYGFASSKQITPDKFAVIIAEVQALQKVK